MNQVISEFVSTGKPLRQVIQENDQKTELLAATAQLLDAAEGRQATKAALLSARNVDTRREDPLLCILLLCAWADAMHLQGGPPDDSADGSRALIHRARSLVMAASPPQLVAYIDQTESHLAASHGNLEKQEGLLRAALAKLDRSTPRRARVILDLALHLARMGRLAEIEADLSALPHTATPKHDRQVLSVARFIDHTEAGRIEDIHRMSGAHSLAPPSPRLESELKRYVLLADLMRMTLSTGTTTAQPISESDLPDWALTIRCLGDGTVRQALRWARVCETRHPESSVQPGCIAYNLIRAELADGNGEAARRLMAIRHRCGNRIDLDPLFLARAHLLAGELDEASQLLQQAREAAEARQALGRFYFEIALAMEIPRHVLLRVMSHAPQSTTTQPPPSPVIAEETSSAFPTPSAADVHRLQGTSPAITSIRDLVSRFAAIDVPVLITGETGTGKEVVARSIHESSSRADQPFLAINCGAISESLLESELFGHEKGAFSGAAAAHRGLFEEAGNGTLLLDEIGEISPRLQVALLRVLETGEIRPVGSATSRPTQCRILASTNADLSDLSETGRFRSDLLFRLRRLTIHIPPLRNRSDDILLLAHHFLDEGRSPGIHAIMSKDLSVHLLQHPWPGNVRELRNCIERMRLMNSDKTEYDLPDVSADQMVPMLPTSHTPVTPEQTTLPPHSQRGYQPGSGPLGRLRRHQFLKRLFQENELLTRSEVIQMLHISPNTATTDMKELCEQGFVKRIQPTASPRSVYFVLADRPDLAP